MNQQAPQRPTFREAFWVWCRVAALSFGGPAGQIAVMHRILVEEKRWVSENRFLHALNYCMLLPGPEAQQLATYIGWLLHRTAGGLMAGVLFVLPGFVSIMLLSILYASYRDLTVVEGIFYGLKPAVVAVVVEAVLRIGKRSLKNRVMVLHRRSGVRGDLLLPGAVSPDRGRRGRDRLCRRQALARDVCRHQGARHRRMAKRVEEHAISDEMAAAVRPSLGHAVRTLAIWLTVWLAPVAALWSFAGRDSVFTQEALFFSKTAMVTFGGAYSVLAYIGQECVETYHWLAPGEMLDGLGMAETTPGPLIQVVQFVGFLGAYRDPAPLSPLAAGVAGVGDHHLGHLRPLFPLDFSRGAVHRIPPRPQSPQRRALDDHRRRRRRDPQPLDLVRTAHHVRHDHRTADRPAAAAGARLVDYRSGWPSRLPPPRWWPCSATTSACSRRSPRARQLA